MAKYYEVAFYRKVQNGKDLSQDAMCDFYD